MDRSCLAVPVLLVVWSLTATSSAQEGPSADVLVDLNEGIYCFLDGQGDLEAMGPGDAARLTQAEKLFTSVIDREPDHKTARLFRALTYGELGLIELRAKQSAESSALACAQAIETRSAEGEEKSAGEEIEQLRLKLRELRESSTGADAAAETIVAQAMLNGLKRQEYALKRRAELSIEELIELRISALEQAHEAAAQEQDHYRKMAADLQHLVGILEHPDAVLRLLEVVANAKIARIDETNARDIVAGDYDREEAPGPVKALRSQASRSLARATGILKTMLDEGLAGDQATRAKFFRGVILFRQAVPVRAPSEGAAVSSTGRRQLAEAQALMTELVDDPATERTWRSYAALYLGLIYPFQASAEAVPAKRSQLLDEAEKYLQMAARLDVRPAADEQSNPGSHSCEVIPYLVARQRKEIAGLRRQTTAVVPPMNDVRLSLISGFHRDTNVVLLGERTDMPRDISRRKDFGFYQTTAVDYTKDLTERLTFGLQGRMSQLWHADVDEYDLQTYGGAVALQYEARRKTGDFGPIYLSLQYDYDYTLLGRSGFLESQVIRPSVRVFWADRHAETDLYFSYDIRDYREDLYDERYNRDGCYPAFGLTHRHKSVDLAEFYHRHGLEPWGYSGDEGLRQEDADYPKRYLTPWVGLRYSWDATKGDEFDRTAYEFGAGVEVPLPWGLELDATASFEWGEYSHGSLIDFHRRPRRDFVQEYGLVLSRTFVLREGELANRYTPQFDRSVMSIRLHARWTDDDSNVVDQMGQTIFEYDRMVYGITVGFEFN